jgi:hypothetical protein
MTKRLLMLAAAYMAAVGLALMFAPIQFGWGAVPPDAGPELIALLRLLGGPFLGIAVLNWLSRDARTPTIRPVVLANMVGFGAVAANDIWGVTSGEAREIARYFLVVHTLFAAGFTIVAVRSRQLS